MKRRCLHGCYIPEDDILSVQLETGEFLCGKHVEITIKPPIPSTDGGYAAKPTCRSAYSGSIGVPVTRKLEA
jgi:hypothetical protein